MEEEEKKDDLNKEDQIEEKLLMGVDEARALQAEINSLTRERDEYLDGWRRAKADLANYKRDELKRLEEMARFGNEELIKELLTVLSNLELSLSVLEKSGPVEKGVYMIKNQFEDILRKQGIVRVDASPGMAFDPTIHEALYGAEGGDSGHIAEEIEAGYLLNGKLLRPAKVKVFK